MNYLEDIQKLFLYYKHLVDSTLGQLDDTQLFWRYNEESNSVAVLIQHISGNMKSRFTDFLTADGEKEWRNRDAEFELVDQDKDRLFREWEESWNHLFATLKNLEFEDLSRTVYIRNQGHTVVEAINRQLAHYPYHVGQIVMLGKMMKGNNWRSLSIPKGESQAYNAVKFTQLRHVEHFTDEMLRHLDG
ncbi:DUF1572 domain-containing protein [Sphingobacterium sp. SRCM116780]|uniref:DUF1572 family protein n=1 Tax=Sphingobacterium sp. SRCM116780 TaxID=2907623 RepID=UPI001F2E0461|nr:DUF1572 family protein [Sphingobacterium sp. SRCM116780]UIR54709.1 DUF1572 domain-containing protein [Sphingobacterium sp. SRCM116780]